MSLFAKNPGRYGIPPKKHSDVYEAISPTRLGGSLQGKVVLVTGAGKDFQAWVSEDEINARVIEKAAGSDGQ